MAARDASYDRYLKVDSCLGIPPAVNLSAQVLTDAPQRIKETAKKVVDKGKDVASKVKSKMKAGAAKVAADAAENLVNGAEEQIEKISDNGSGPIDDFVDFVKDSNDFDRKSNKNFNLVDINKNFPIIDQSVNCPQQGETPASEAGLKVDVDVAAKLTANVGFIVAGSIVPPDIEKLAFIGGLSGDVSATINVDANAKGTLQTPDVKLFEVDLPGLSFPGIVSVGPSFGINANAKAELGVVAHLSVGASFALPDVQSTFPPFEGDSSAKVDPKDAPIKLNVGASATLTGRAEAHLIPRLDIGVAILNGAAQATVFADVDASASLDFSLTAKAEGTLVDGTAGDPKVDFKNVESSFGGSVGMALGLAINVGAEAALEPFIDESANFEDFQQTSPLPLFEKNFGDQARKRSVLTVDDGRPFKRALTCPGAGEGNPVNSVVDAVANGTP